MILCFLFFKTALGLILRSPRDTEALVDHMTFLNCSTSTAAILDDPIEITWYFFPLGSEDIGTKIYSSRELFHHDYGERFEIDEDQSKGIFDLVIPSVQLTDAGLYECVEERQDERTFVKRAHLIVLESQPVCRSNMSADGVIGYNGCGFKQENFQLSCSVSYRGNKHPEMEWKKVGEKTTITKGVSIEKRTELNLVKSYLTMKGDLPLDGVAYVCKTTRSVTAQYKCTSDPVKISYFIKSKRKTLERTVGDEVLCFVNTSQMTSCSYKWSWRSEEGRLPVTLPSTPSLIVESEGIFKCEAKCKIRNRPCETETMFVNVLYSETEYSPMSMLVVAIELKIIVVVLLVIIGIVVIIQFLKPAAPSVQPFRRVFVILGPGHGDRPSLDLLEDTEEDETDENEQDLLRLLRRPEDNEEIE